MKPVTSISSLILAGLWGAVLPLAAQVNVTQEHNNLSRDGLYIDSAFTRRFQIVLHFPRPELAERRLIWELAFPKSAPLEEGIDFDLLARLDLTGAGIVGAAQTAALMALEAENENHEAVITKSHVVHAIARQYRREARLLTSSELGPYAPLLQEVR